MSGDFDRNIILLLGENSGTEKQNGKKVHG